MVPVNSSSAGCVERSPVSWIRLRSIFMPASMTTDLAASSGLPVPAATTSGSPFPASSGKKMLAISSDIRITPAASAMIRSRSGKLLPSPRYSGMENAPASVTAPRTPEMEVISCDFNGDLGTFNLRLSISE
ncbi:hypothetical protein D3C73_1290010 [compost metagenome]